MGANRVAETAGLFSTLVPLAGNTGTSIRRAALPKPLPPRSDTSRRPLPLPPGTASAPHLNQSATLPFRSAGIRKFVPRQSLLLSAAAYENSRPDAPPNNPQS